MGLQQPEITVSIYSSIVIKVLHQDGTLEYQMHDRGSKSSFGCSHGKQRLDVLKFLPFFTVDVLCR
jgi:hypothetical protein